MADRHSLWRDHFFRRRDAPPGGWRVFLRSSWEQGDWKDAYRLYLLSGAWSQRRKAAIKRTDGKCQLCGIEPRRLHVHHTSYSRAGAERREDIRVLCRSCHGVCHSLAKPQNIPLDAPTRRRLERRAVSAVLSR